MALTRSIDRVSSNDLTVLASDHGPIPMNIAAVLDFAPGDAPSFEALRSALADRLPRVPRLRQRLVRTPPGCGRPVWADDPVFDLSRHLSAAAVPGGRDAMLTAASAIACQRLPQDVQLWRARLLSSPSGTALVFVAHHVMADGLGGLTVLSALADDAAASPAAGASPSAFPRPVPPWRRLAADAWRERLAAVAALPRSVLSAGRGLRELGLTAGRPMTAERTAFNRPTGPRRRLTTVDVPLDAVLAAAHARRCTLNDIVLAALAGAMARALRGRGASVPQAFVVSVPISQRAGTDARSLGNATGVVPVRVPTDTDFEPRLAAVSAQTAARRAHEGGGRRRGSSAGPLGVVFRLLGRTGLFQRFIDRQRLVNTFLSNLRGPAEPISLAGHRVAAIVPMTLTPGNVGVCFAVLSYAGQLVVSVLADPDLVADQDDLTAHVSEQLIAVE